MRRDFLAFFALAFLASSGCGASEADSSAAVQRAIQQHLQSRSNLDAGNMNVALKQIHFEGDRATAEVTISAREDPRASMQMVYQLRRGTSGWEVEPQQGGEAHAGSSADAPASGSSGLPGDHPTAGHDPGSQEPPLPPGHPPVGGQTRGSGQDLPAGHPPVPQPK